MYAGAIFLEVHHFRSGLEVSLVNSPTRPDWLPPTGVVQLSQSIAIRPDELVVEFSRHRRSGKLITWIGAYRASETSYGNRGAYCAVGVWLVDRLPIDAFAIVSGLTVLSEKLSVGGFNEIIQDNCEKFQRNFLPLHSTFVDLTKADNIGLPYDEKGFPATLFVRMPKDETEEGSLEILAASVLDQALGEKSSSAHSRIIYVFNPTTKITDPEAKFESLTGLVGTSDANRIVIDGLARAVNTTHDNCQKEIDGSVSKIVTETDVLRLDFEQRAMEWQAESTRLVQEAAGLKERLALTESRTGPRPGADQQLRSGNFGPQRGDAQSDLRFRSEKFDHGRDIETLNRMFDRIAKVDANVAELLARTRSDPKHPIRTYRLKEPWSTKRTIKVLSWILVVVMALGTVYLVSQRRTDSPRHQPAVTGG